MSQKERQSRYIEKKKKRKECLRCSNKALKGKVLCKDCTIGRRIYQRSKTNGKPWVKGRPGRPPIYK